MKKKILLFFILLLPFFVKAVEFPCDGYVNTTNNLRLRVDATTDSEQLKDNGVTVAINGSVTILEETPSKTETDNCSSKKWYKVKGKDVDNGKSYTGYGCSAYISIKEKPIEPETPTEPVEVIKNKITKYGTINNAKIYADIGKKNIRDNVTYTMRIAILKDANDAMYEILYDNLVSYIDKSKVYDVVNVEVLDTSKIAYNYEEELNKFPDSYKTYLNELHKAHPDWRFYAVNTNLKFSDVIANEQKQSYMDGANDQTNFLTLEPNYYNWKTNTWTSQDSGSWYVATKEAIEYYVDPRNYLTEKGIFVFEDSKAYTYQKEAVLRQMIEYAKASDLSIKYGDKTYTYYDAFKESGEFTKVSPLTILARSRIETGKFTSNVVSGIEFYYNGKAYSGYYNYYNIGAWAHSGNGAITNGLIYAYNAGWNNRYKAIVEGASFIATKYIYAGQETQYFQKFNVNPKSIYSTYGHQYQTNIAAPTIEGGYVYWGYNDTGSLNEPIVFLIPVYLEMPKSTVKPIDGNPNNWLTEITIDDKVVSNYTDASGNATFDGNLYYSYDNNWDKVADYTYEGNIIKYNVSWDKEKINIKTKQAVATSKVSNIGDIELKDKITNIDILVEAENKTTKVYRLIVTKDEKPDDIVFADINKVLNNTSTKYNEKYMYGFNLGTTYDAFKKTIANLDTTLKITINKTTSNKTDTFATGDVISIDNGEKKKNLTYVLYGDLNGDANIDVLDLIHIRNIILEETNLQGSYKEAGDVNHDGVADILDLILLRNNILGEAIKQ